MMKPRAGNIDSFCSELSHSNLKGLLIYPVRISDILSTGQGPGELTKAHQNKKKIFGRAAYDLESLWHVELKN